MSQGHLNNFADDIPELVRGRLDPARANEILRAAETDEHLRRQIGSERELERLLDLYETPEPSAALEGAFWRRFHEAKVLGDESVASRRTAWLLKLVGPLAAGVLIAVGIVAFYNPDPAPIDPPRTAEERKDTPRYPVVDEGDEDWDDLGYLADTPERLDPRKGEKLGLGDLELLKKLDAEGFLALDRIQQPEDLALVDDLELLQAIDRAEGR
ncbi:MAG: hypothetical protein KF754_02000 [Planctomycetes bacterium]|nr:hypothetical protein [Planctomycetota bacterium]